MADNEYFVHESAYVDQPCQIGNGTKIWHFSHVQKDVTIGRNCILGQNVNVASGVTIGDRVKIQNNVSVYHGVVLEDETFCGPSMVFTNVLTPRSGTPRNTPSDYHKTLVRKGATIGANATVVCGVTLGTYAFVGAGAVVTHDVADYALVYGNPARLAGWMCECGIRLELPGDTASNGETTCAECGRKYVKRGGAVSKK